jgi:hypothetical protein
LKLEITQITDRSWPCLVLFSRWVLSGSGGSSMKGSDGSVANWRNSWPPLTSLDLPWPEKFGGLGMLCTEATKNEDQTCSRAVHRNQHCMVICTLPGRNRLRMVEVLRYLTFENRCKTQVGCLSSLCRCYASESGIWPGMVILVILFK